MKFLKVPMLSMNFSENKNGMKMRFSNILNGEKKRNGKVTLTAFVVTVFLIGGLVGCNKKNDVESYVDPEIRLSNANDLETAMVQSIFERNKKRYAGGECAAEGHIVLGNESKVNAKNNEVEETYIYSLVSYGEYGFENGIFTKVSGSGAIPTKFTFVIDESGEYQLKSYEEAKDGSDYVESVKEMFPRGIAERALHYTDQDSAKLQAQEEVYASEYLVGVRDAEIQLHVKKTLANMNVKASNTLLDSFYEYPYWIGTQEQIEDGIRYVYEKQWEDKGNGDGVVTFKKYEYDTKNVIDETIIEIKNGELNYIKGEVRQEKGL